MEIVERLKGNTLTTFVLAVFDRYPILKFAAIGASGSVIHIGLLYAFTDLLNIFYIASAVLTFVIVVTSNYALNHYWTFKRSKIRHGWFVGWIEYVAICSAAHLTYLGMLAFFTEVVGLMYIFSSMVSILINFPLKYFVLSRIVWLRKEE